MKLLVAMFKSAVCRRGGAVGRDGSPSRPRFSKVTARWALPACGGPGAPDRSTRCLGRATAGYTLVETMVTSVIGTFILAGVLTSYVLCARYFYAISNYWEIHSQGRYTIERFACDMRAVSDVASINTNSSLVVTIPITFDNAGNAITTKTVTYSYTNGILNRTDSALNQTDQLAANIYQLQFRLYDRVGNLNTVIANSKSLQVELYLRKFTAGRAQTEDYLSARLDMRNKP